MAKLNRKKGTTSQILHVFIQDSSSTTGAGLTGLAYTGAGITPTVKYINAGGTLSASITLEDITTLGTYQAPTANTNMRFKEVNSASPSQGIYEIHVHNDWMNLTGGSLVIMMAGATNMAQFRLEIDLQADANVTHVAGTAQTAGDIIADTNDIQTQIGIAGAGLTALVDLVWDEVLTGGTHNVATSAGKRLRLLAAQAIVSGTIPSQAGMAINAITLDAAASDTSHLYVENLLVIDSGAAIGEAHHILSYNGTTKVAIIDDDWITQPVAGDTYQIFGASVFDATTGLASAGSANTITLEAAQSSAVTDYYINQSVYIASGMGAGQRKRISAYDGGTKVATVSSNWATNPDNTSAYMIYEGNQVFVDAYATNQSPAGVKKNSALNNFEFYMIDSSDDVSGKTGLTVTAERNIDGAAFGACANAVSEVSNGLYKINLAAADLNGDVITLKFTATGANATVITILTKA